MLLNRTNCDLSGAFGREMVDAGADRWKGNGRGLMFAGEFKAAAVAPGEQMILVSISAMPHRPNCMKDPFGGQSESGRGLGVAGCTAAEFFAGRKKLWAGGAMNRPVNASAAEQRRIRRIDDRVHLNRGDVALNGDELRHFVVSSNL